MSTKNLAHTVIEGGRQSHDKYDRRISLRYWRHDNRAFCRSVRQGTVDVESLSPPVRVIHFRWRDEIHADKTNPCDRFLASRAGRHWDDVRSEICRRFDRRKLAGMHVTNDHLLNRVQIPEHYAMAYWWRSGGPKFWVDENGILRHNPSARY